MTITLHHGDCREIIPALGVTVDAVVTDPPYGLEFMGVAWDSFKDRPKGRQRTRNEWGDFGTREHARGQHDIARVTRNKSVAFEAFSREWAEIVYSILKPGGYLLAFGGTRTYHRMTCAIEDAGFVIQDCLMWLFATGFPKRRDMLKPAYEPIVLAYKPGGKRTMQVDECRIAGMKPRMVAIDSDLRNNPILGTRSATFSGEMNTEGRWPANVCLSDDPEVVACFPHTASRQDIAVKKSSAAEHDGNIGPAYGRESRPAGSVMTSYGDEGSAARFFFSASTPRPCALCGWPCSGDDGIISQCSPASNAANNSPLLDTGKSPGSALNNAPACSPLDGEVRHHPLNSPAPNAEEASSRPHPIEQNTAHQHASDWLLEKIVQNVRSAAHLCGSCATAIAQNLAASRQGRDPEPLHGPASISETSKQILTRSLALYAAGRESTDIILTTPSLRELFGSVFHAIAENINSERSASKVSIGSGQKRLHFSSKAGREDRWGSSHPTVKPVDLISWLVKLVCPKDGLFLDPFAGSGTAAVAALKTGRNAILIEREADYIADIKERLAFYEGGGKHSMQAKNRNRKTDDGPLFGAAP